ncbi:glycoside hydrolase/deacetylase [Rhizopus microsporus var. microsporus]|uniref:Polysaccharide deacetylase family protein n=2 Tax=Rhizopus microsporus TaxID=58291 RepID=A0A2G4SP57_RHIZD|nr:polysaccharide deacetylase family protein [Rhizopus microsporus ATCC 52813]ORE07136.1 glycoside hydrolase/deacetylase [Rhizopus microsporus var. microsporus]PHZ10559.1 polysaccharide deacetylase family protein [Rhizopus microsporus ATCC 52813]
MYLGTLLTSLTLTATAVFGSPLLLKRDGKVYTSCNRPNELALTFDDGPYIYSWELAEKLHNEGIKATFFINGKNWVDVQSESDNDGHSYMDVIKHYYDLGHQVASHTYEHRSLTGASEDVIKEQMDTLANIIESAIGKKPAMMRPPEGNIDDNSLSVLTDLGYKVVTWDIDTRDWENHDLSGELDAYKSVMDSSSDHGHIALQHEVYEQTVNDLVPKVVEYAKEKDYKFVTVAECIDEPAYQ